MVRANQTARGRGLRGATRIGALLGAAGLSIVVVGLADAAHAGAASGPPAAHVLAGREDPSGAPTTPVDPEPTTVPTADPVPTIDPGGPTTEPTTPAPGDGGQGGGNGQPPQTGGGGGTAPKTGGNGRTGNGTGNAAADDTGLPVTGTDVAGIITAGGVLTAGGAVLIVSTRRRRRTS